MCAWALAAKVASNVQVSAMMLCARRPIARLAPTRLAVGVNLLVVMLALLSSELDLSTPLRKSAEETTSDEGLSRKWVTNVGESRVGFPARTAGARGR